MRKTKFYSVFVAFIVMMFAAIAAAVAFAVPSKSVAKAEEAVKVYDYEVLTGPEDTNRNPDEVYFGISVPASVKAGDTFEISIGFLNRKDGVDGLQLWISFSTPGLTVNKEGTYIPQATKEKFDDGPTVYVRNDGYVTLTLTSDVSKDEIPVTDSFIELLTLSVTADDIMQATDEDLNVHYYMLFSNYGVTDHEMEEMEEGIHYTSAADGGYEIVVKGNSSEDVTMATGYPVVSANGVTLNGALGTESKEYREDINEEGAPGIGGLRHTTYQSYDIASLLSYSTESLTVVANANDSTSVVKMLTNPAGDDSEGNEKYTVENNNTYTFDISELTPDVADGGAPATDQSGAYYKYTLPYVYKVFAEANGYVRVYSITFYKEKEAPSELPLTLNSVRLVSKDNAVTYNSIYDQNTRTYTILAANGTDPLTISYVDAKQDNWEYWSIVAERAYTGSEVTTTGAGIVKLKSGSNKFELVISDGTNSENYFVEVNVAQPNTDKSLTSVIVKNKNTPGEYVEIIDKVNGNVFTADEFDPEKIGETWMVEVTATEHDLVEITYPTQQTALVAGENTLYVKVTDQLGDYTDYTVIIPITANTDTTLGVLKADDTDITKGSDGNYVYKISDTVNHFYLTAEATESSSTVAVYNDGTLVGCVDGKYLINVNLSDSVKKQEITVSVHSEANTVTNYTIIVTRLSSDATLKKVYIENASGTTYDAVIDNAAHTVTISDVTYKDALDATAWTLCVEANSEGAEYVKSKTLTSFENNNIVVTPETGAADAVTYTVTITSIAGDEDAGLSEVYITNGTDSLMATIVGQTCTISGMTYAQSLDSWTMHVKASSDLAVYTATVELTSLDGNKITVTPEKGAAVEYTVIINRAAVSTDTGVVVSIKAGNADVEVKNSGDTYSALVNYDEIKSVTVTVAATSDLATVKIGNEAVTSKGVTLAVGDTVVAIEVTAESGDVSEYSVIISAYTESAADDTDDFITIGGDVEENLSQSEFLSNSYIVKDVTVKYSVNEFTIVITAPEYIEVTVAYGSNTTVTKANAQTAALAAAAPDAQANGTDVKYTVKLNSLQDGNNVIMLEITDTRTNASKTYVHNVFRESKPVKAKSNGAIIAFMVIFLILFIAVTVLLVLSVLGILDLKKLFSKIFKKKSAKSE